MLALTLYAAMLAVVLLGPSARVPIAVVARTSHLVARFHLPQSLADPAFVELLLNAAILVPVPVLGCLVWPSITPGRWAAIVYGIAAGVELCQTLFLPARSGSLVDLTANTAGGCLGAVIAAVVRHARQERRGASPGAP